MPCTVSDVTDAAGQSPSTGAEGPRRDFFISYTGSDQQWAEWIAWELEEAGYTTILQAWDFAAGSHFVTEMHQATQVAERTIAVLSHAYVQSSYAEAEWQEAWRSDPLGARRKLLVFRVEECPRSGLLAQLVSVDLFEKDFQTARSVLLATVRQDRRKPPLPPGFPGHEAPTDAPPFPGRLVPADHESAMAAGGPQTPDNPFAVAFAFWYIVMEDEYPALNSVITPESRGRWNLEDLRQRTADGGITTGVIKPCYDVAYVRLMREVGQIPGAVVVAGGLMPSDTHIISLVLRPELGGWRVHGFGYPLDPGEMPRTWQP